MKTPARSRMSPRLLVVALVSVLGLLDCDPASADSRPKWELGVGSVFYTQPDYVGSDEYRFLPIPFPWIVYRGSRLRLDRESAQTKIFGTDLVRLDISAGGQVSVDSDKNDRRHGMRDLDWIAQIGPTVKFRVGMTDDGRHVLDVDVPLRTALAIDTDNFSYEGLVASPKLQYRFEPQSFRVEANAGLEFSSNDYNDYVYRVGPQYATEDRRAYNPDGGYAGVRLSVGASRYWGPIYLGVFARYTNLAGAAFEDSPLVGTNSAFMGGIAIGWVWCSSKEMVPVGAEANLAARDAVLRKREAKAAAQTESPSDSNVEADAAANEAGSEPEPGSPAQESVPPIQEAK